ncbi:MAG: MmcQ/YjbR family DNA-binding protein [Prevotella sp.]|nr:MmcQ/YjbR family DNA-binding protein [Prevotella sp.]
MNIQDLRDYCLSLSDDIEEKTPFAKFHGAEDVLVFYVGGHMFCYFDINQFDTVTVKCQPERIAELKEQFDFIEEPYNGNRKYWIGIRMSQADDATVKTLVENSFLLVRESYRPKKTRKPASDR